MKINNDITVKFAVSTINKVIEDSVLAIPFIGNLVAVTKSRLFESDVKAYPAIALTGQPASGKTTIADTVVIPRISSEEDVKFEITGIHGPGSLAKVIYKRTGEYLILDDFARYKSSDTTRRLNDILDTAVRSSYGNKKPAQLLLTAEPNVLENVTESLKTRMILIDVTGWKECTGSKKLIEDVREAKDTISVFLKEFDEWFNAVSGLDIKALKDKFASENSEMDDRSIDNFFVLNISLQLFARFMEEEYKLKLNIIPFADNCKKIWSESCMRNISYDLLIYELIKEVFNSDIFDVSYVDPKISCPIYCERDNRCEYEYEYEYFDGRYCNGISDADDCNYCSNENAELYYDPYELYLPASGSILIKDTKHLYGFPNYLNETQSLLIVSANKIIPLINNALDNYCRKYHVEHDTLNIKMLSKVLGRLNLCMHIPNGKKHTFLIKEYPVLSTDDTGVYIFRLNSELFNLVNAKAEPKINTLYKGSDYAIRPRKLISIWKSLLWRLGKNQIIEI